MDSEDKELCLQWNSHSDVFQSNFGELLNSEEFADVTISCQGRNIHCHKIVLSICSSYFRNLLREHSHPHPILIMSEVKYEDLLCIVKFMYTGEVTVPQSQLGSLVGVADALKIKGLAETENERTSQLKPEPVLNKRKRSELDDDDSSQAADGSSVSSRVSSKSITREPQAESVNATTVYDSNMTVIESVRVLADSHLYTKQEKDDSLNGDFETVRDDNENINLEFTSIKEEPETDQNILPSVSSIISVKNSGPRYTPDDLEKAIMEVLYGTNSITSAAKAYNIPVASLFRRVKRLGIQSKFIGTTNRPKNRPRISLKDRALASKIDVDPRSSSPPQLLIDETVEQSEAYQAGLQMLSSTEALD
ncbi:longitudinals lacking protein, isoforms H/M/V-like [Artemia franciscana]|uniref:longitudinals lacking protein, isoforms H/M/V-like n=1 Tax=Artemia franciscana TaxID=6661 RepID=UPI0032DAC3C5